MEITNILFNSFYYLCKYSYTNMHDLIYFEMDEWLCQALLISAPTCNFHWHNTYTHILNLYAHYMHTFTCTIYIYVIMVCNWNNVYVFLWVPIILEVLAVELASLFSMFCITFTFSFSLHRIFENVHTYLYIRICRFYIKRNL